MRRLAVLPFLLVFGSSPVSSADDAGAILAGTSWTLLGQDYQLTADSAVKHDGTVYFTDSRKNRICKIDPNGKISVWKENSGGAHGISAGPDGRLYAGQHDRQRIVRLDLQGRETILAEGVQTHHLKVTRRNEVYYAQAPIHTVGFLDPAGRMRPATTELNWPHGLALSADDSRLFVADTHTLSVMSFAIQHEGSLSPGQVFCRLETRNGASEVDAGGMTFDTDGFLYVATNIGVQVFDPAGRMKMIIDAPVTAGVSDVFFAGPGLKWLYVTDGDKIYRRLSKRRGAR